MSPELSSWRELLKVIIANPEEKARIAGELGINPVTLTRWVNGEAEPRPRNLQLLRRFLPQEYRSRFEQLVSIEYPALAISTTEDTPIVESGVGIFRSVLEARATTVDSVRFWTISLRVIQHALRSLDPEREGIAIMVVCCMPPASDGLIYSLRETEGQGTPPWESNLAHKVQFLGAESLAGHVVTTLRPEAVNLVSSPGILPAIPTENEASAMAHPVVFANRVAGCLLVSSAQPNYFVSQTRRGLIADYASLLSLAFEPEEFYPLERISLRVMPPWQVQRPLFEQFQQRVLKLLHESSSAEHSLSRARAELAVWQQLESELIASTFSEVRATEHSSTKEGVLHEQR